MRERLKSIVHKLKDKCDFLEIRIEDNLKEDVTVRNGKVESVEKPHDSGGCVRAAWKGGWAFASFNNLEDAERFARTAIEQAKLVGTGKTILAETEPVIDTVETDLKSDPRKRSLEEKVELMRRYDDCLRSYGEPVTDTAASYTDVVSRVDYVNSDGTDLEVERFDIQFIASARATKNGDSEGDHYTIASPDDYDVVLGLEPKMREICEGAVKQLEAPPVKGGRYTVILDQELGGTFIHEAFGHTMEADRMMDNPRMVQVLPIGKEIAGPIFNVYDSGDDPGVRGCEMYDDEGTRTKRTYLIKEGRINSYLHSRESAGKLGMEPTGNARAVSFRFPPIVRMRNTCIEAGESTFEELLSGIDLGVYAIGSVGGSGGEMFTFTANRGFMIRKGKIEEMVRNVKLVGNLFITLKNIDKVGSDFLADPQAGGCGKDGQWPLAVNAGSPHIRIQDVTIGGVR